MKIITENYKPKRTCILDSEDIKYSAIPIKETSQDTQNDVSLCLKYLHHKMTVHKLILGKQLYIYIYIYSLKIHGHNKLNLRNIINYKQVGSG